MGLGGALHLYFGDLVLYYVNSRRPSHHEFSREDTPFPYRPLAYIAPRLHDDAIGQLRLPLTAYQTFRFNFHQTLPSSGA